MNIPMIPPGDPLPEETDFAYTTARTGHYLKRRTSLYEACVAVPEIDTLPEETESFRLTAPKIPRQLFTEALAFFQEVAREKHSEAMLLLTFVDGMWGLVPPEQDASMAHISYEIPEGVRPVGSIHSHPGMGAFHSATDEADEAEFDGIHIVVSDRGWLHPEIAVTAIVAGQRIRLVPSDVIDGYNWGASFPTQWLDAIDTSPGMPVTPLMPHTALPPDPDNFTGSRCGSCGVRGLCDFEPPKHGEDCLFFEQGPPVELRTPGKLPPHS